MSNDEVRYLRTYTPHGYYNRMLQAFSLLVLASGCKSYLLRSLTVSHINFKEGFFRVNDRLYLIDLHLRDALHRWLEVRNYRTGESALFTTKRFKRQIGLNHFVMLYLEYRNSFKPPFMVRDLQLRFYLELFARYFDPAAANHKEMVHMIGFKDDRDYRYLWLAIRKREDVDLEYIKKGLP